MFGKLVFMDVELSPTWEVLLAPSAICFFGDIVEEIPAFHLRDRLFLISRFA